MSGHNVKHRRYHGVMQMLFIRNVALFVLLIFCVSSHASSLVTGSITNASGRPLAHITVTLTGGSGDSATQFTNAFGRYQFMVDAGGTFQLAFSDENFINFVDEDPFPDEGSIYSNAALPQSVVVNENQDLDVGNFVLSRVDNEDNRQNSATVTDCTNFGDDQSPQTLSYALLNAREVTVECAGTLIVPEITITKDTKINASANVALEAAGFNRLLRVLPGVALEINGVDLTNGNFSNGIAIFNLGELSVDNAEITGNRGSSSTILNHGTLNLSNFRQFRNSVNFDSVLTNTGVVTGTNVVLEDHIATGGPVIANEGQIELRQCSINGLGTNNVWSVNNTAGATIKLFNCTVSDSGSLFSNDGTLEIFDSNIDDNSGDQSLIESNGVLRVGGTGITNNDVDGGIVENSGLAIIINSTVSGNEAGFGLNNPDFAGSISNTGLMQVTTSTIANNTHPGAGNNQLGNSGELTVSNSIISGVEGGSECNGISPVQSIGHNLHTDGTCGDPQQTDSPFGNPGLLALADNGGPGKTHALQTGSDAIDTGDCGDGALSKDQRGIARPQGNGCDIGAYELVTDNANAGNETDVDTDGSMNSDAEASNATVSPIVEDENSADTADNTNDGTEDPANIIDNSTDGAVETTDTTDVEQTDTATIVSETISPDTSEPQRSGGGSIDIPVSLWVLYLIACLKNSVRHSKKTNKAAHQTSKSMNGQALSPELQT